MELGETPEELLELQDKILMGGVEAVAGTSSDLISNSYYDAREAEKRASGGRKSREVMAKPSGNNSLTFFMPEEEEEEEEFAAADAEEDINSAGAAHPADEEENLGDNQSLGDMPRERQLTQKFLAGQLSFKDLMQVLVLLFLVKQVYNALVLQEMKEKEDEEEGEEETRETDDEEWRPPAEVWFESSILPSSIL